MKVFIEKENKTISVRKKIKNGIELLSYLKINADSVLIIRKNEVLLSEDSLDNSDEIQLLSVVSGG